MLSTRAHRQAITVWLAFSLLFTLGGCAMLYRAVGGSFDAAGGPLPDRISPAAMELVSRAFDGLDAMPDHQLADFHVHHISDHVHPHWRSWAHPIKRMRTEVFMQAAGISQSDAAVDRYIERVGELAGDFPDGMLLYLYALDHCHDNAGQRRPDRTPLHVSNESVYQLARQHPDLFVPVVSIHPHRDDAIEQLHRWASSGCRHIKWLPNAMEIDPSDERVLPFYNVMRELDMVLLTHTGDEHAIEAKDQSLGNPQLLRAALDAGVKVVALHAASDGRCVDLDCPRGTRTTCFELFLRMMDNPKYDGLLWGEISAITFVNHLDEPLRVLLDREDLHHRLVNGSDYPICAVNVVIQTSALARQGFITSDERRLLNELYRTNPQLFDFLVKRTIRHPQSGRSFSADVFLVPPALQ